MEVYENMIYYVRCCQVQEFFHQFNDRNLSDIHQITKDKKSDEIHIYYPITFYTSFANAKHLILRLFETIYNVTQHYLLEFKSTSLNYIYKNKLNFEQSIKNIEQRKIMNKIELPAFETRSYSFLSFDSGYGKLKDELIDKLNYSTLHYSTLTKMKKLLDDASLSREDILEKCKDNENSIGVFYRELLEQIHPQLVNQDINKDNLFEEIKSKLHNVDLETLNKEEFMKNIIDNNAIPNKKAKK